MKVLWFEFTLSLRRLFRRKVHSNLLLVTFGVSVTLSALSWTLFQTVHLSKPSFDPKGEYLVLSIKGKHAIASGPGREEMKTYQASQTVFDDFAEMSLYQSVFVETPSGRERVLGAFPSSRVLQIVGAKPILGTLFNAEDDRNRSPAKILLSERLWTDSFGRDPDVLGKPMKFMRWEGTIVGVMPRSFRFPNDQDIWISYGALPLSDYWSNRTALVKLKPGISKVRAEQDLNAIFSAFTPDSISQRENRVPELRLFRDAFLPGDTKTSALILMALSLLFLAVSCANAANLMLIDFLGRRPELAASLALGVPRAGIVRALCCQVGIVAVISAGVAACLLPHIGPLLFERIQMVSAPYWLTYQFNWGDVGIAFLFAGIAALVTVTMPIVYLMLLNPDQIIREHAYSSRGTGRAIWRRLLLTGQIALLTVLGVCTALLVRSSNNVGESKWGYDAEGLFNGKISVGSIPFTDEEEVYGRIASVHQSFLGIRKRSETASAAYALNANGYGFGPYCTYASNPEALVNDSGAGKAFYSDISDQYFDALGVSFAAGEDFPEGLARADSNEVIINESLARRLWPDGDALQRTLYVRYPYMEEGEPPMQRVVRAVVRDYQACGPRAESNDAIFTNWRVDSGRYMNSAHIYVRDKGGLLPTTKSLSDAIHREEPRAALYFPSTVKRQITLMLNSLRMTSDLSVVFAVAAVILCAIGVYSLTVTHVLQSSREFGIRMALGAEPEKLWWIFTRGHLLNTLVGVSIGVVGATQVMRVLESLLYGVDPYGSSTYIVAAGVIISVAVLACLPSLTRLRKINPSDCLRSL